MGTAQDICIHKPELGYKSQSKHNAHGRQQMLDGQETPTVLLTLLCLIIIEYIHSNKYKGNIPHVDGLIKQFQYVRSKDKKIAERTL